MASTTNYSWSTPDNSGLVKNGAQDIRTLGSAVDTSLWNVGFGQAGKNKIINGDFRINQRSFSSSTSGTGAIYNFDRWMQIGSGGTTTWSAQTFTLGAAPVAGYEGTNFLQIASTGQSAAGDNSRITQKIESVRTFAGQTVTVSFWAKATSGTPSLAAYFYQDFGTGGSPSSGLAINGNKVTLSTSWARYSVTIAIPSISGKTLGTNNNDSLWLVMVTSGGTDFNTVTNSIGIQTTTIQMWGMQVEYGAVATPFQTATGTIQGELSAAQRYYWRFGGDAVYQNYSMGLFGSTTTGYATVVHPVPMRVAPTVIDFSTLACYDGSGNFAVSNVTFNNAGKNASSLSCTVSGATQSRPFALTSNNSTSAYLGLSAEL